MKRKESRLIRYDSYHKKVLFASQQELLGFFSRVFHCLRLDTSVIL